ncbi:MAG: hypothetical protein WD180_12615 [Pseudohongiellaceae bacterium]
METLIGLTGNNNSGSGATYESNPLAGLVSPFSNRSNSSSSNGKSVLVQPQLGLIMVTATPAELARVEQFIQLAQESLSREVVIQIQVLEVILNKGFQSAIDFDTFGPQAHALGTGSGEFRGRIDDGSILLGSDNNVAGELESAINPLDAISNPFQFTTNFTDFDAVFRILESRGTTQIVSSPNLRALNNQKAVFQDGTQEYFQTNVGSTVVAGGENVTTSSQNDIQPFFSGISMDITPQISADGGVTLHVHPIISAVVEQTKNIGGQQAPLAQSSIREIDSVIKAENGKIIVLGGLAYERDLNEAAGLPGANRLPVVGAAFEQRQQTSVKSEFIILLKPIIADSAGDRALLDESNERFRQLNRAIDPFAN